MADPFTPDAIPAGSEIVRDVWVWVIQTKGPGKRRWERSPWTGHSGQSEDVIRKTLERVRRESGPQGYKFRLTRYRYIQIYGPLEVLDA